MYLGLRFPGLEWQGMDLELDLGEGQDIPSVEGREMRILKGKCERDEGGNDQGQTAVISSEDSVLGSGRRIKSHTYYVYIHT